MVRQIVVASMVLVMAEVAHRIPGAAHSPTVQATSVGDPKEYKGTILERMVRTQPTYRGDDDARLKWEWWVGMSRSYLFEKNALVRKISLGHSSWLRPEWALQDVKVSFEEIYRLGDLNDDKLVPILSHPSILDSAPGSTFEGLTLYGKDGEVKGTITRKYTVSTKDYPSTYSTRLAQQHGTFVPGYFNFVDALEYKDSKNGDLEMARGNAPDAVNLRWGDIKNRLADDISQEKTIGDMKLLRDAFAKSFKDSMPDD